MQLYIAEKPSFGKVLAEALGVTEKKDGYIECGDKVVTWAFGHLYTYADPDVYTSDSVPRNSKGRKIWRGEDLPIVPKKWQVIKSQKTSKQIKVINGLLRKCKVCVNAADPDREGEEIFRHIVEQAGYKGPIKRLWCSSYDNTSVKRAIGSIKQGSETIGFANAARARARADWLIGMNYSRVYTLASTDGKLFAIGRVQTPTLKLIVDRDRSIENFVSTKHYMLNFRMKHSNGEFDAAFKVNKGIEGVDSSGLIVDKQLAENIKGECKGVSLSLTTLNKVNRESPPPLLLSQTKIAELASKQFGYSAKQTLDACQSLYEKHKATTYPRTDCAYLPESQAADIDQVLDVIKKTNPALADAVDKTDSKRQSRVFSNKHITAHHAIIPTLKVSNYSGFSATEKKLFDLISLYYIAQFYPNYTYAETDVTIEASKGIIKAKASVVDNYGWKVLFSDTESSDAKKYLPVMNQGDKVDVLDCKVKQTKTNPPKHFVEGELVVAMSSIHRYITNPEHAKILKNEDGIGTGATRPNVIDDLKKRKYIEKKGKYLVSTELGSTLVDSVPEIIKSPVLTALFERQLKLMETGDAPIEPFLEQQIKMVQDEVERVKKTIRSTQRSEQKKYDHNCPACNYGLDRRKNRQKGTIFWACVSQDCKKTYSDVEGAPKLPAVASA